ncbi:MAG: glycosyltransferase, partial [Verrucomicrobiota bacterium]|nr:glycosyltransferase [Verrucomicrobiota bacterium]
MIFWLTATSCFLALVPALLFLKNLRLYARLPQAGIERARCSVLIPARDEEANIAAALRSVLQSTGVDFEVVVLDDDSSDRTAEIVREFVAADARVRLETAPALPTGWCGKNFACHQLASLARHPLLIFMDADVRISRADSLARLAEFVERSGAALVSGVPHEETRSLMEKLIIPLIHFVLLGFLPLQRMRSGTDPRFAAACGQI